MEMRYKGLFMVCLILGLQIHLPVTMFPAGNDGNATTYDSSSNLVEIDESYKYANRATRPTLTAQQANGVHEYNIQRQSTERQTKHDGAETLNKSPAKEHIPMKEDANQARHSDLPDFKSSPDFGGLERGLSASNIESVKSVLSRLPSDILNQKLDKIRQKLDGLSANLTNKRNIIQSDRRQSVSAEQISDAQLSLDQVERGNNHGGVPDKNTINEKPGKYFRNISKANENRTPNHTNYRQITNVEEGIYWSKELENRCPKMYTDVEHSNWRRKLGKSHVIKIEPGCGSMQNRLVTFNDSTKACARYRLNADLMQGDIYSYYLGKLLGINYTPPTTMAAVDRSALWETVQEDVKESKWTETRPIILSKWLDSLSPAYMPDDVKKPGARIQSENYQLSSSRSGQLCDLVQWSDLMVFDYISANLDRVVNNMFNLKWNPRMLEKPIHNLEKATNGQFVFLDNESGLFHGYRLLETYEGYMKDLLKTTCVFRKSTVAAIERLVKGGNTGLRLQEVYGLNEPYHTSLPRMPERNMKTLHERVTNVYKHIQLCKHDNNHKIL